MLRGQKAILAQSDHKLALEFSMRADPGPFWNFLENLEDLGYLTYHTLDAG